MIRNAGRGRALVRAAVLVARNPVVFVPSLVLGLVGTIAIGLLDPIAESLAGDFAIRFVIALANVIVVVASVAATAGLADSLWKSGSATLSDARRAFEPRTLPTVFAMFGAAALAALISPLTLGLSFFAGAFALLYAIPAAVSGGRAPVDALTESIRIGLARLAPTIGIVAAVVIVRAISVVVGILLSGIPFVSAFIETFVLEIVTTYVTVLVVGEYRALRNL